ncbi:TonB-dependent receptor domain-containing protein [Brevundimonas sp. SL161]|uniref:TonB-dependent receptor domain-containing protein n=1 Tax=Brevundimonas sp. SL161 TaxID=2804613 RepID=UPI003CEBEDEF
MSLTLLLGAVAIQSPALAQSRASETFSLNIPQQRADEALLTLALQTRRSLGGDIRACRGVARGLRGAMSVGVALDRLLTGSGCAASIRADGAILIRSARLPPPPARSRPVAPASEAVNREAADTQLGDIVVTAERRPETPEEVAAALTAIAGLQLEQGGVTDMIGVASLTAGMTVTNLGSGRNKILLRGMSDGAFTGLTQSTVALYLNQIPITYNAPDPDLKLVDIDRIEVLRGPQGTLYGTGPIGGVIRTITRQPDSEAFYGEVSLTRSETRSGGPNSDYSVMANLPILGGRAAIRAVAYEEQYSGYINDVALNLPQVNEGRRSGGRVALAARLGPDWNFGTGLVHQSIDTEDTHYVIRGLGRFRRANLVREPHENDFNAAYVTLDGQAEWGRLDASIGYVRHDFRSRFDASPALIKFGSRQLIGALDEDKDIELLTGELSLASPQDSDFRWLAGAFLSTSGTRTDTTVSALQPVPGVAYAERRSDQLDEVAVFGEVTRDLTSRLSLTAGARYYDASYSVGSRVAQGAAQRRFSGAGRANGFSPKLALAYRLDDQWNVYAQVSRGHRVGGFNTAGPAGQKFTNAVGMPGREYGADSLWNYEGGAKGFLWNGTLRARIAVFMAHWRNIQSDQFLPSGLAYAVNVGDGANKGLEIETTWRPTSGLEIRANALFADPEITRPGAAFNSRGDAGLPGVPKVSSNIVASYHRPLWNGLELRADGHLAYVGASRLTFDAERRSRMGDYMSGRVSLGVEAASWSATAFVDNPFDTQANTFAFGDPFRLPEGLAMTPLRPRTIGLTLNWRP